MRVLKTSQAIINDSLNGGKTPFGVGSINELVLLENERRGESGEEVS